MKNTTIRLFSFVLILASFLSFVPPVSANAAKETTYAITSGIPGASSPVDQNSITLSRELFDRGERNYCIESYSLGAISSIAHAGNNNLMKFYTYVGDYIAFRIKSPGSGIHSLTLKHGTFFRDGVASVYMLPGSTTDIDAALIPANRVGKVNFYNENTDASTDFQANCQTVVGSWAFEAEEEYIMVLQCSEPTPIHGTMCYLQLNSLTITQGELTPPIPEQKVDSIIVSDQAVNLYALTVYGATGMIGGVPHVYVPIDGKKMYVYNLQTGQVYDEVDIRFTVCRGITVDDEDRVWMIGSQYFLQCYDPYTKSLKIFSTLGAMDSGFDLVYADNGCLYFGSSMLAHLYEFNIATETLRDFGSFNEDAAYACGLAYGDGYLYAGLTGNRNSDDIHTREIVKIRVSDGVCVGRTDVSDCIDQAEMMLRGATLCGDTFLAGGIEMNKMLAIDVNTMEQKTLYWNGTAITNPLNYGGSESYDGKRYFFLKSGGYDGTPGSVPFGLYSMDEETGKIAQLYNRLTGSMRFGYDSIIEINGHPCICWYYNDDVRYYDLVTGAVSLWKNPKTVEDGASATLGTMGKGENGSNILYLSAFKNDLCSIYDISTGTVTGNYYTNGQTDSAISYQGNLYVGNYKSGTLVRVDTTNGSAGSASAAQEKNTVLLDMRYTLDENGEPFNQVRVPAIAAGGNKVFAGTTPNSYLRGGCLGWYDLETGEKYIERHVVENQSITSLAYQNGYLFGTSGTQGGTGAEDDPTLSAKIFIYNVATKQKVKEIDLRDYISGLPERLTRISPLTPDPYQEGKFWGVVRETLYTLTYNAATGQVTINEEMCLTKDKVNNGSRIYYSDGYLYTYFSGSSKFCKINYSDPTQYTALPVAAPSNYIIGDDGNLYYTNDSTLYMYPLQVTDSDRAAALAVDNAILSIQRNNALQQAAEIQAARSAYDALTWTQRSMVSSYDLLEELEVFLLEDRIDTLDLSNPDAEMVAQLDRTYRAFSPKLRDLVRNYHILVQAKSILNGNCYSIGSSTFNTLEEALENADSDTVIKLLTSREEGEVTITGGATLDLNGNTLLCESLDTVAIGNGHIIDSQNGAGLLQVSQMLLLREDNAHLPLLDTESMGYRFFGYTMYLDEIPEVDGNKMTVWFYLGFASPAAYELVAKGGTGLQIGADLHWNGKPAVQVFFGRGTPLRTDTFSVQWAEAMAKKPNNTWLYLTVTGLDTPDVSGTLTVFPLVTAYGVKAQSPGNDRLIYQVSN